MRLVLSLLLLITISVYATDLETLKSQAIQRDSHAQYELAQHYQDGDGVKKDQQQAFYWLEQAAENGNQQAQNDVVDAYLNGIGTSKSLEQAIYWLTYLATHGNTDAQLKLGNLLEQRTPQLSPQTLALIWYRVAAEKNPQAADRYSQLLEKQFNQQRAKQISQIKQLDKLYGDTPEVSPASSQTPAQSTGHLVGNTLIWGGVIAFFFLIAFTLKKVIKQKHKIHQDHKVYQKHTDIQSEQLVQQRETIKKQKQQLTAMFQELKRLQQQVQLNKTTPASSPTAKKLELACTLFGYSAEKIPDIKQIKLRYKQLSKVYHPDLKGSDEEMKRLNQALKIILAHLKS